ncbi:hypothetical protein [Salinigranum salinum]|uniref:hypothetical protein n=1 Tax=Salinigranum salinum TaxID=1364937 RepID=UPI0012606C14|nr:hypothetical protein [Salinigranum salinum]
MNDKIDEGETDGGSGVESATDARATDDERGDPTGATGDTDTNTSGTTASETTGIGTENTDASADELATGTNWSRWNWSIILLFAVLTLVGVALAVGVIDSVVEIPEDPSESDLVVVPLYVFLYAGFGALGYVITKLMNQINQYDEWSEVEHLVAMGLRIPAAWILAAGIFLFIGEFGGVGETTGSRFTAGVAFLVGLYVNVALKALGSLADRILGRSPRAPEASKAAKTSEASKTSRTAKAARTVKTSQTSE